MKSTLASANILPLVVENGAARARPYLDVKVATVSRENNLLEGGSFQREQGMMDVTVVVDEGTYSGASNDYADEVAALFPEGLTIAAPGGDVVITAVPDIRPGFNVEAEYRTPVMIRYEAVPNA